MSVEYDAQFGIGIEIDVKAVDGDIVDYLDEVTENSAYDYIRWGDMYEDSIRWAIIIPRKYLKFDLREKAGSMKEGFIKSCPYDRYDEDCGCTWQVPKPCGCYSEVKELIKFVGKAKVPTIGEVGLVGGLLIY